MRLRELIGAGAGAGQLSERELASRTGISRATLSKLLCGKSVRRGAALVGRVLEAVRMWVADHHRPTPN
jgi:transcriptional regulator with XRE-family HTH domain